MHGIGSAMTRIVVTALIPSMAGDPVRPDASVMWLRLPDRHRVRLQRIAFMSERQSAAGCCP
jgi:hypothetical protein